MPRLFGCPTIFPPQCRRRSADSVFYRSVTGWPSHWSPRTHCLMVAAISELYLYLKCKNSPRHPHRTLSRLEQLLGILTMTGGGIYQWARIAAPISSFVTRHSSTLTGYIYITKYFLNHQIFGSRSKSILFGWRVRKYRTAACVTAAIRRVRWRSQKTN